MKVIELKETITASNDRDAEVLRESLRQQGTLLINLMASPGAGKTTMLDRTIRDLGGAYRVGVMEADIDSDVDAVTVARETGCPSVQLHTGGMCHLDAGMTAEGLRELGDGFDLVFLENVGNLVCPAEYDTGAHVNVVILSVPEGDDKPLKYPLVFEKCDLAVISKTDALPYFDFDMEQCKKYILARNRGAAVIPVSAKTGENMEALENWFTSKIFEV